MKDRNMELFNECSPYFEALKDKHRQNLLMHIIKNKKVSVGELANVTDLSMSAVSHHLKLMSFSGLIRGEREGLNRYYRLTLDEPTKKMQKLLTLLQDMMDDDNNVVKK